MMNMDKNNESPLKWDEEEQKSWILTFTDTIKKFFKISNSSKNISNDAFIKIGESEEEKNLIREQCEEIDSFYENRTNLVEDKKGNQELRDGDWMLQELEKEANEICKASEGRNMTLEEILEFRQKVKEQLDKKIISESEAWDIDIKKINQILLNQNEEESL